MSGAQPTQKQIIMSESEIIERLKRIEYNSLLAAKNVLVIDDVALLTNMSKSYLYSLTSKNKIPFYRPNGKQIYFDKSEIENWLKQNRVSTIDENKAMAESYCMEKGGIS